MRGVMTIVVVSFLACGSGGQDCTAGTEDCECTPAGLCDPPATCVDGTCVIEDTATDTEVNVIEDTVPETVPDALAETECAVDLDCNDDDPCTIDL